MDKKYLRKKFEALIKAFESRQNSQSNSIHYDQIIKELDNLNIRNQAGDLDEEAAKTQLIRILKKLLNDLNEDAH